MSYARPLQLIHWTVAFLVICQLATAAVLGQLRSLEYGQWVLSLHRQMGMIILLLVIVRFIVARKHRPPAPETKGLPPWQVLVARAVHTAFLWLLVIQPFLGVLLAWARGDEVSLLGLLHVPAPAEFSDTARERFTLLHAGVATLLLALCAMHVGAVVFNHVVRRVSIIDRMLPAIDPRRLVNRVPLPVQLTLAFSVVVVVALTMGVNAVRTYRDANRESTAFYERDLTAAERARVAQVALKELVGLVRAPQRTEADVARMRELLDNTRTALEEAEAHVTAADVKAGIAQTIRAIADAGMRDEIFEAETLLRLDARLQETVDAQDFAAFQQRTRIDQQAARAHDVIVLTILPMVLAGLVIPLLLARSVTDSLKRMHVLVRSIESDQHAEEVSAEGQGEFAILTRDILGMRSIVARRGVEASEQRARFESERARLAREQQERETAAERQRSAERRAHRERVAADFELQVATIVETVARTAQDLAVTASSMTQSASETTQCSRDASTVAEQTSGTASAIASGTADLSHSAQSVRENAQTSQARAMLAVQEAAAAKEQIDHLVAAARQIGSITELIATVTRQTNLLAINARVEAARAGEFGRGFSIVADEVKALANQTRQATHGIGEQIEQVNLAVSRSSQSLQRLREVIGEVEQTADAIFKATDAQFASTRHIADRVTQISASTASVAQNIRHAESTASRTEDMSAEVTQAADVMGQQAVRLHEQVAEFVLQLRSGDAASATVHSKVESDSGFHRSHRDEPARRAIA